MQIDFASDESQNITTLHISGRPGWAKQVTNNLKPQPGQVRGHVIEWNTWTRAFKNQWQGKPVRELRTYIEQTARTPETRQASRQARNAADDQHTLVLYLKEVYNNLDNLDINQEDSDTRQGGDANTLAQILDKVQNPLNHLDQVKLLFQKSFNPGLSGKGWDRFPEYQKTFASAWGVPEDFIRQWAHEMRPHPTLPDTARLTTPLRSVPLTFPVSSTTASPLPHAPTMHGGVSSHPPTLTQAPMQGEQVRLGGILYPVTYHMDGKSLPGLQQRIGQLWSQGNYQALATLRAELVALHDEEFNAKYVQDLDVLLRGF